MFSYVLNTPISLVVNEVWVDEESISLIRMKNQQKIKALLNGTDEVSVEQWTKMFVLVSDEVEAVEHFELLVMKHRYINAVTQRV